MGKNSMFPSNTSGNSGFVAPRPRSALSVPRPRSGTSVHRPPSVVSLRPVSRHSARFHIHQTRNRLIPLVQTLVRQVAGFNDGEDSSLLDQPNFRDAVELVLRNLDSTLSGGGPRMDLREIDRQISGHALKARLKSQDKISEALEIRYQDLKATMGRSHDLDQEITDSHIPDHLQFLIKLSNPPSTATEACASYILHSRSHPSPPPVQLTWASIVAEEPFEGEHWEGLHGLPPGFVRNGETRQDYDRDKESQRPDWDSSWSTPSLSPLNSDDLELDINQEAEERAQADLGFDINHDLAEMADHTIKFEGLNLQTMPPHTYAHREVFEALRAKQYWRNEWRAGVDVPEIKPFYIGDPSTLGPTLQKILRTDNRKNLSGAEEFLIDTLVDNKRYISEEDVVREVLTALQGRSNMLLGWNASQCSYTVTECSSQLLHFSLEAQASVFASFARSGTVVQRLRFFVSRVFEDTYQHDTQHHFGRGNAGMTRTREAFADAIDHEIRIFDKWCAGREEAICRAWGGLGRDQNAANFKQERIDNDCLPVSLLGTEKALRDSFEQTFDELLELADSIYPEFNSFTPSRHGKQTFSAAGTSAALLDQLFAHVQAHLERQEHTPATNLLRVLVRSVEPIWDMIGRWLRDGMGSGITIGSGNLLGSWALEDEFFIEYNELNVGATKAGLLEPDFWKEGYTLRAGVVTLIETHGGRKEKRKTIPLFLEHVAEIVLSAGKAVGLLRALEVPLSSITAEEGVGSFRELVASFPTTFGGSKDNDNDGNGLFSLSIDTVSQRIYDHLLPRCQAACKSLAQVLVDDCELWVHLTSIEDLYLMRHGDTTSYFTDILFSKMDTGQSWNDFHFLNTIFRDAVEASFKGHGKEWIQVSLVRLSYRGSNDRTVNRTMKVLSGLSVDYAVPFPLTYIFTPATLQGYDDIFVFLLQMRRAKCALDRILVRGNAPGERFRDDLKVFYAMRSRLSWFINTFSSFLATYVLHVQVGGFHEALRQVNSLDDIVRLHDEHLDRIRSRCLLKQNTASLHRAIISILDMALHFADFFVTVAGNTTTIHDISRQSISVRRHRSRHQRYQRRNAIGFTESLRELLDSSDDSDDDSDPASASDPSLTTNLSVSYIEEGFQTRLDKMSTELDGLVRFIRRGVESLAGASGEAASAYSVLAFALEDWDL